MGKYSLSPASQDMVDEYVLKAVKLTRTMLTLLPPPVVVIPQYYDDSLQDTNRATWNENKVGPDVKITHYRPVLLYGNHAHVAVKGLVGNYKLESERTSCNTSLPTSAGTSKVEDSKPHTSYKPPSPIPALPGTTPTSTGYPKQETPHCSTYSTDYHGKQTPIRYATSRTSPTDRDLVNKTHFPKTHTSKVEDPKPHTSHKPPSPIPALPDTTPTSTGHPKQETPHCSTHSTDYHEKQTPIHYVTSSTSPTDRDLVNKTHFSKTHTSKVEDSKPHKKLAIPVTSHKPPPPTHPLPDKTQTSIRQPKQETPHCSTYFTGYHSKQTPIQYTNSRTTPTNTDLVNKMHSPTPLNISKRQLVPSVLTQSLILPSPPISKSTVPSVSPQSLSVPPPVLSNFVPLATSQSLTLPQPPISSNLATSQHPYQATNVMASNKSQQVHASRPFTTTSSSIFSLQVSQNIDSPLHHENTGFTSIPPPPLDSKPPDSTQSGRAKHYRKPSRESPPSPNKQSPVTKKVLSSSQADSKTNRFLRTPVTKESHSAKKNAVSKERVSIPEPQKCTDSKTTSPGTKPLSRADSSKNSSLYLTNIQRLSSTSRSQGKSTKKSINPAVFKDILPNKPPVDLKPRVDLHSSMKQNQKTSPSRQRQSQPQNINQQKSVENERIKERTHHMTLRSTSKKKHFLCKNVYMTCLCVV